MSMHALRSMRARFVEIDRTLRRASATLPVIFLAACPSGNPPEETVASREQEVPSERETPDLASRYEVVDLEATGIVRGTARLGGGSPPVPLAVDKDLDVCFTEGIAGPLRVGPENVLADVVVWLEDVTAGKAMPAPEAPVTVEVEGCSVEPRVRLVPMDSLLVFFNRDDLFHDLRASNENGESVFRHPLPVRDFRAEERLSRPGIFSLACDAGHPWMAGYLAVQAHPYYELTGSDGVFVMEDVPPGTYRLLAWHELTRRVERSVTVEVGGAEELDLVLAVVEEEDESSGGGR